MAGALILIVIPPGMGHRHVLQFRIKEQIFIPNHIVVVSSDGFGFGIAELCIIAVIPLCQSRLVFAGQKMCGTI